MSAVLRPIMRREVEALFESEKLSRQARRLLIEGEHPATPADIESANVLIDAAISQLVKARAALNGTEAVEPL